MPGSATGNGYRSPPLYALNLHASNGSLLCVVQDLEAGDVQFSDSRLSLWPKRQIVTSIVDNRLVCNWEVTMYFVRCQS